MPPVSLIINGVVFVLGLVVASIGWKGHINAQKLEAAEKREAALEAERKRNAEIVTKHSSDLYQVLDYYRRNPVRVSVLSPCPDPGNPSGRVDVAPEDVVLVVGGAKAGDSKAVD